MAINESDPFMVSLPGTIAQQAEDDDLIVTGAMQKWQ